MNEGKKTGIFWIAAALMLCVGGLVSYQPSGTQNDTEMPINEPLFADFKDPLVAATMKIVTFDEVQGTLGTFEIRKDRQSGNWTIPSRDGYPADAVEQMKNAANSLVDLRVLDTIVAEPADHENFGVVEPNLEALNVGDEGVGRLVTFKDSDQNTLASMIIGDPVKDQEGQIYVRKPNQDLVYVVPLDDKPLTTKFQDWIEDDLLKISSIDIQEMVIKDYNASVNPLSGQVALNRKYDATLSLDGAEWKLDVLKEFDPKNPLADPKIIEVAADQKLNTTQLNQIKNALDDVKIADVVRKPEGMSANLKADKELASDNKARQSLARHGFYPVTLSAGGDTEILSANGELAVGLNDGVEYILRFGNISGLSKEEDSGDESADGAKTSSSGGVNRYLLVTTRVNEEKFPPPALKPIPQTIEEYEAMKKQAEEPLKEEPPPAESPKQPETEQPETEKPAEKPAEESAEKPAEESAEKPAEESTSSETESPSTEKSTDQPKPESEAAEATEAKPESSPEPDPTSSEQSGEGEANGSGEASGSAQGQDPADESAQEDQASDEAQKSDTEPKSETKAETEQPPSEDAPKPDADAPKPDTDTPAKEADQTKPTEPPADEAKDAEKKSEPEADAAEEMSEEEKQELLESEQEKITKENQRALDERKDKLEAARRRVRDLNARFADWYYVVPEDTYSKLRINRDELFETDKPKDLGPEDPSQRFPLPNLTPPGN